MTINSKSSPELLAALERAKAHKMTPDEQYEQMRSFAKGMCPFNRDYAEYCKLVDEMYPPRKKEEG